MRLPKWALSVIIAVVIIIKVLITFPERFPVDTGLKLNLHKMFRRRPGQRLMYVQFSFVSTGDGLTMKCTLFQLNLVLLNFFMNLAANVASVLRNTCNHRYTETYFIFSVFVSISRPRSINVYLCYLFFIFSLIFIVINHINSLKQTYLAFMQFLKYLQ